MIDPMYITIGAGISAISITGYVAYQLKKEKKNELEEKIEDERRRI